MGNIGYLFHRWRLTYINIRIKQSIIMMVSEQLNGEIGADGFLKPGHPFLLIAGSSDVREEMGIAQQTVQEVLREYGIHDVAAYVWDVQAGPEGLDQRRTM